MRPVDRYAAALRQTLNATLTLGADLAGDDWQLPTECPLWTVGDVYGHVTAGERWMAGGHPPPHADEFQDWIDADVQTRRGVPRTAVLAELADVYQTRVRQLEDLPDPQSPATYPWGEPTVFDDLLATRVLDCWVHEQDIRRAVGRPGGLGSAGARVSRDIFARALPRIVARNATAPPGATVRVTVVGEVGMDVAVAVDGSGRGRLVPATTSEHPTAHVTLGWESYARLCAGRGRRGDHHAQLSGDAALAERVLAHLAITP